MKKSIKTFFTIFLDFFEIVFIGFGIFVIVFVFVARLLVVEGDSMIPNFHDKEQLIAEKVSIKITPIKRGEIIIFKSPKNSSALIIKRVIGLPGEILKISNGKVYINGTILEEPYLPSNVVTQAKVELQENIDYVIPADSYILLGDNRQQSTDSRDWGALSKELIIGRGFLVYYPFENFRFVN